MRLVQGLLLLELACVSTAAREDTSCGPDEFEPNDMIASARNLGVIQDDPGASKDPPQMRTVSVTAHTPDDVDWFTVEVRDTGISGNPVVNVILSSASLEATAWFECRAGRAVPGSCGVGTMVQDPAIAGDACRTTLAVGDTPPQFAMHVDCSGTSTDDGTLRLRVRRSAPGDACVRSSLLVKAD